MKNRVPRKKKTFKWIVISLIVLILTSWFVWYQIPHKVSEASSVECDQIRTLLKTPGTSLISVNVVSSDSRVQNGTLIKSGSAEYIITAAHFFGVSHPPAKYEFFWRDSSGMHKLAIGKILKNPMSGIHGESDIAICIPGAHLKFRSYAQIQRDTEIPIPVARKFDTSEQIEVIHLPSGKNIRLIGTLHNDSGSIYVAQFISSNGMSGGGFLAKDGRIFVLSGNIPDAPDSLLMSLGLSDNNISLISPF